MRYQIFPFSFQQCKTKKLIDEIWFDLNGLKYPDGLPFKSGSIDFEWLMTEQGTSAIAPLIGTAQDEETGALYVWLSKRLLNRNNPATLCSVGNTVKKISCHNLAADRPKILESHFIADDIEWTCTMSTHLVVAGVGSQQSWGFSMEEGAEPYYTEFSSTNGLIAVHNFWVPGSKDPDSGVTAESKKTRNIFVEGSMEDVRENFSEIMAYALRDSVLVNEIMRYLIPAFYKSLPSDIRQEAALIRGNTSLALAPHFKEWVESCEEEYQTACSWLNKKAATLINLVSAQFQKELLATLKVYELEELPPEFRTKKGTGPLMKKWAPGNQVPYSSLALNLALNPLTSQVVSKWEARFRTRSWGPDSAGLPKWLKTEATFESPLIQDLCELVYFGQQVVYEPGKTGRKFCYVDKSTGELAKVFSPKKGPSTKDNCGSLFAKDFVSLFEDGSITSEKPIAIEIVTKAAELSYWTSIRSRMFKLLLQRNLVPLSINA
jgi:DNA polymerase gamma 1